MTRRSSNQYYYYDIINDDSKHKYLDIYAQYETRDCHNNIERAILNVQL